MLGVLDAIGAGDVAAHPVPQLPAPPNEALEDAVACMQWRVQRVWAALRMPPLQQLDMLLQFAQWGFGGRMDDAMAAWEAAVAAVSTREALLSELAQVRMQIRKFENFQI
jgi:hypothetical protein